MKRVFAFGVYFFGVVSALEAGAFHVPQKYQECDQWCWAGCSQAVLEYYGPVVTQTNIAIYGAGGFNTWNYLAGTGTEEGVYRRGIREILENFGGFWSIATIGTVSQVVVSNEMSLLRPIVINWLWNSGGGHYLVCRGLTEDAMYLMDPWDGPMVGSYAWVCNDGDHAWAYTLCMTNRPIYPDSIQVANMAATSSGEGMTVRWNSVSNKFYRLECSTNLADQGWTIAISNIPATWPHSSTTVSVSGAAAFYRIRWEP